MVNKEVEQERKFWAWVYVVTEQEYKRNMKNNRQCRSQVEYVPLSLISDDVEQWKEHSIKISTSLGRVGISSSLTLPSLRSIYQESVLSFDPFYWS